LEGVLSAPFKNQLTGLLPKYVVGAPVDLDDTGISPGRWYAECYMLRNRIVHEGQKASAGEACDAKVATGDFCTLDRPEAPGRPAYGLDQELSRFRRVT
jgi:hypothetical protein